MRRCNGRVSFSRILGPVDGDGDRPFTVWIIRFAPLSGRFVAGRVGLAPDHRAVEYGRRYRTATREQAERKADAANTADLAGESPEALKAAMATL